MVYPTITILDPTCGSGAFLFAALRILHGRASILPGAFQLSCLSLAQLVPLTGGIVVTTPQAVSVADALTAWRQGRVLKGLGALCRPYNFLSLAALLEGRHWVRNNKKPIHHR